MRFRLARDGRVLSSRLERPSGDAALDNEVLAMVQRAAPLPPFPAEMAGETVEMIAPVVFSLH